MRKRSVRTHCPSPPQKQTLVIITYLLVCLCQLSALSTAAPAWAAQVGSCVTLLLLLCGLPH